MKQSLALQSWNDLRARNSGPQALCQIMRHLHGVSRIVHLNPKLEIPWPKAMDKT